MVQIPARTVHYIVKVSKFCNLRCRYCYELPELGNPDAMSLERLDRMYTHIADHYGTQERPTRVVLVWHGGEPLIQAPDLYWETFARQKTIFGAHPQITVENVVQTNLTLLDDERIRLLKEGFQGVGVSIDLFGGLRVNLAGKDSQARVLSNIDRLRAASVRFGGISVLTRRNFHEVKKIFRFYERLTMSFRLLPLFPGAFDGQHADYSIKADEVLEAFCTVADLWLESDKVFDAIPVTGHIQAVARRLRGNTRPVYYNRRDWETAIMVNTNGDAFGYPEAYDAAYCYGNIFNTSVTDLLSSESRERSVKASEMRMALSCARCTYFGSCSGYSMAEDNHQYIGPEAHGIALCHVERNLMQHIETRLKQTGLFSDAGFVDPAGAASRRLDETLQENPSLSVPA
ncbi:radical SAM protein [Chondromyces crocatus]|uniref:Radical SAM protein n=1 Tax=Chondromyces crocatus TaxID=52 RepID=A0A0K1ET39_CHOCO|nr:radical SAM protein [Chondromyces crocatus]AKT43793.1 radical SAM protein [Chondromyces crocatus]